MAEKIKHSLYLYEEVLLLGLQDQKGKIDYRAGFINNILAGAIVAELLLAGRISIEEKKSRLVNVIDSSGFDDLILNWAIKKMTEAKRRKPVQGWITTLAGIPKLMEHIAQGLCKKGILKEEESEILWIFKSKRYPEIDHEPERKLLERIQKAIFTEQENVDTRTSILISLSYRSNLLSIAFSNKEIRNNSKRIEKIINGELIGRATDEVIKAVQAAAAMSAVMPAIMTSTIISSS